MLARNHAGLVGLVATIVLTAVGCGGKGSSGSCTKPSDCKTGESCVAGTCKKAAALAFTPDTLPAGTVGQVYSVAFQATGGVGADTWSATGLPAWIQLAPASGQMTGVPTAADPGSQIVVTVTDSQGTTASHDYTLVVDACTAGQSTDCFITAGSACMTGSATCQNDGSQGQCTSSGTPSTDTAHCGPSCGTCDPTTADACAGGVCQCGGAAPCTGGVDVCCGSAGSAACVDIATDPNNCGGCGNVCPGGTNEVPTCQNGSCVNPPPCQSGYAQCVNDPACNTHITTTQNCGSCGNSCAFSVPNGHSNPTCDASGASYTCGHDACQGTWVDCNGVVSDGCEIDTGSDMSNCGTCTHQCGTTADACTGGTCTCIGGTECTTGQTCCSSYGGCHDLQTDANDCGTCGHVCSTNVTNGHPVCTGGGCGFACDPGYTKCGSVCVDTSTNTTYCGSCTNSCTTGKACQNGSCCMTSGMVGCTSAADCCSGLSCLIVKVGTSSYHQCG